MSLKTKLYITLFIGFFLLVLPLFLGINTVKNTSNIIKFIKNEQLLLSELSNRLNSDLKDNQSEVLRAIILNKHTNINSVLNSFSNINTDFEKLNNFIKKSDIKNRELHKILSVLNRRIIGYRAVHLSIEEALNSGDSVDIRDSLVGYNSIIEKFNDNLLSLITIVSHELEINIKEVQKSNDTAQFWIIFSFITSFVLIAFSVYKLMSFNSQMQVQLKRAEDAETNLRELQKQLLKYNDDLEDEISRKTEELHTKIYTNFITGMPNRNQLIKDMHEELFSSIALLDIDKFQQFNDVYGEEMGNVAIRMSAEFISSVLKDKDYSIYHTSGDEFVVGTHKHTLEFEVTFIDEINSVLELYRKNEFWYDNQKFNLIISAGLSFSGQEKILAYADMALKDAKRRNIQLAIFDDDKQLEADYKERIICHQKLLYALENDKLISFFQPIIPIQDKTKPTKYESLVRILDGDKVIPPFIFIDVAKKNRLYAKLTKRVIENTLETIEKYKISSSFNLSVDDISDHDTMEILFKKFNEFKYNYLVTVELLETEDFEDYETVEKFCKRIRSYGIKIALDDFGAGYSNFSHILNLPIDFIKIDASLIANIDRDPNAVVMVDTIVGLAKKLHIQTIAEFVASKEILSVVTDLGVDYAQGFHLGRPDYIENHIS
jgi:diguanylate cyclase (GGDEF)-like protein